MGWGDGCGSGGTGVIDRCLGFSSEVDDDFGWKEVVRVQVWRECREGLEREMEPMRMMLELCRW